MMMPVTAAFTTPTTMMIKPTQSRPSIIMNKLKIFPTKSPTQTTNTTHRRPFVCSVSSPPFPTATPSPSPEEEEGQEEGPEFMGDLVEFVVGKFRQVKDIVISAVFADSDGLIKEKLAKIFPMGLGKPIVCGPTDEQEWKLFQDTLDLLLENMDRCVKTRAMETVDMMPAHRNLSRFLKTHDAWRADIGGVGELIEFHFRICSNTVFDDDQKLSNAKEVADFLQKLNSATEVSITVHLKSTTWVARGGGEDVTRGV